MENKTPIIYKDEDHSYWRGETRIPGISELLKYWGFIDSTYYTPEACQRGTVIHDLIADSLSGGQEYMGHTSPDIVNRLDAFNSFVAAKGKKQSQIVGYFQRSTKDQGRTKQPGSHQGAAE